MKMEIRSGFTLIELSIVLVIIGLIVGGILVGEDLIDAARIRQQIRQIEDYKSAVNTFVGKYNAMPGDMRYDLAGQLGLMAGNGSPGQSDGNGMIEGCAPIGQQTYSPDLTGCETEIFWNHLAETGLIAEDWAMALNPCNVGQISPCGTNIIGNFEGSSSTPIIPVTSYYAQAKIGRGASVTVQTNFNGDPNYFEVAGINGFNGSNTADLYYALTPLEAYALDSKIDDGLPTTGTVQGAYSLRYFRWFSNGGAYVNGTNTAAPITCTAGPHGYDNYNINGSAGTTPSCQLIFILGTPL